MNTSLAFETAPAPRHEARVSSGGTGPYGAGASSVPAPRHGAPSRPARKRSWALALLAALAAAAAHGVSPDQPRLYNPYERPKNGPPLTDIFHKVEPAWLLVKLRNPKHHPAARMPDFKFTHEEALDVMAYLKSIAREPLPNVVWPTWAGQASDRMSAAQLTAMRAVVERGKVVWGDARCTICHTVNAPGGRVIGGFVDLRVGGIDLQIARGKLNRDWLYAWIKDPKSYFPETLMPRYRLSDSDIKALAEYILRDDAFRTPLEVDQQIPDWKILEEPERVSRGKRRIELFRCVICHDIKGISEILNLPELRRPPAGQTFEFLAYDLRCLSCHSIEGRGGTYAPDLTGEGSRLLEAWIAKFVESPDLIRPLSQQMPKFNLTSEEARTIASYMSKQRRDARIPAGIPGGPVQRDEIERGRKAFQTRGCFSCHTTGEGPGGVMGPDLAIAGNRLQPGYIWFHLKNPHAINPYSAEPDYGLPDEEARALAGYISTRKK